MGTSVIVAYTWSVIVLVVFFLAAVFVSNSIAYRPGGGDDTSRRIWFWVLCALTPLVSFGINSIVAGGIRVPAHRMNYLANAGIGAGAAVVLFILMGFVLSRAFSRSKISSWF